MGQHSASSASVIHSNRYKCNKKGEADGTVHKGRPHAVSNTRLPQGSGDRIKLETNRFPKPTLIHVVVPSGEMVSTQSGKS